MSKSSHSMNFIAPMFPRAPIHTPLTSHLLQAWDAAGTVLGERHLQEALRLDTQRVRHTTIPSVRITMD